MFNRFLGFLSTSKCLLGAVTGIFSNWGAVFWGLEARLATKERFLVNSPGGFSLQCLLLLFC